MKDILLVFIGGGLGSALRLLINKIIPSDAFPYSTITVNLIGSFLIGFIISYLIHHNMLKSDYYYFLVVGICGGLTYPTNKTTLNINPIISKDIFSTSILQSVNCRLVNGNEFELFKEGFVRYRVKQKNLPFGRFFEVSSGFEPL